MPFSGCMDAYSQAQCHSADARMPVAQHNAHRIRISEEKNVTPKEKKINIKG